MEDLLYITEIIIYRKSFIDYCKEQEVDKEKLYTDFSLNNEYSWTKESSDKWYFSQYWKCWQYNTMIWAIKIYYDWWSMIKADYYWLKNKLITKRLKNKIFEYKTRKLFEIFIPNNFTNDSIYTIIFENLENLQKWYFKKYYIDIDTFSKVWKFIDYKKFFNSPSHVNNSNR